MSQKPLGRLVRHDPRKYWKHESSHFTPWLAGEENIAILGEAIGLELEVEGVEVAVGPFYADILCNDLNRKSRVLIENQLERTDHDHLGKLFTYAAGLDAATVVWIAREFRAEHRAALDWLNDISGEDFNFFGLTIELMQIGNSPLAPWFEVIVKPNEWSKIVKEATSGSGKPLTEGQQFWLDYWAAFGQYLEEHGKSFNAPKPVSWHWVAWGGVGGKSVSLTAGGSQRDGWVGVWLVVSGDHSEAHFHLLHEQKQAIEDELGFELAWEEKPGQKEKLIAIRDDRDLRDRSVWPEVFAWKLANMKALQAVFRARVEALDAASWASAEDDE